MTSYKYPFNLLTPYFVEENKIDTEKEYEICVVRARALISANRFDLMAKWIYIDARERNLDMEWATELYRDNINAFSCGSYLEPGTDEKNSFQKYIEVFNDLIEEIKTDGFDEKKSLIPVGHNNILLDGAHRVTIAAYYDKNVTIIRFPELSRQMDYKYFRKYLMSEEHMGYMAIQYSRLRKNCFLACLWPVADKRKEGEVEKILQELGPIVYSQEVYLTYQGVRNFMIQIYGTQAWAGDVDNGFTGIDAKAQPCYEKGECIKTYLFEAESLEAVIRAKSRIRELFKLENHSIHISDNAKETESMAEVLYNSNSVKFMNCADLCKYGTVIKKLETIKKILTDNMLEKDRFLIGESSVLDMYGINRSNVLDFAIDYGTAQEKTFEEACKKVNLKVNALEHLAGNNKKTMIYNPQNYFYYQGIKFMDISRIIEVKNRLKVREEIEKIKKCKKILGALKEIPKDYRVDIKKKMYNYQIEKGNYGEGELSYREYKKRIWKSRFEALTCPFRKVKRRLKSIKSEV